MKWQARVLPLMAVFALGACTGETGGTADGTAMESDSVRVAAAWSWGGQGSASYGQGIALAVEEVNADGGIGGIPLAVRPVDDGERVHSARLVAAEVAASGDFAAVIGHLHSHISLAAAPIYEAAGILMLSPGSTAPELTRSGGRLVFRTANSDSVTARHLAAHALRSGYGRVAICYVRSEYGAGLANAFERAALDAGIEVVDRRSYEAAGRDAAYYRAGFADWASRRIDAVLLAGTAPSAAIVLQALRLAGIRAPVFGGDGLDDEAMASGAGESAEGLAAVTFFHPQNPRGETQRFLKAYQARFGREPDSWAARGYEAVHLLAGGMNRAGSTRGAAVAEALRTAPAWETLSGWISFSSNGEPRARPGVLIRMRDGTYRFESELTWPSTETRAGGLPLATDEVVQDQSENRKEDDEEGPEHLVSRRTGTTGQLE